MRPASMQLTEPKAPGYPVDQVDEALSLLGAHLPQLRSLRMDALRQQPDQSTQAACLHLQWAGATPQHPTRVTRVRQGIARNGWHNSTALKSCLGPYNLDALRLRVIERCLEDLRDFNPFGAWAVTTQPADQRVVVQSHGMGAPLGMSLMGSTYVRELAEELSELMPEIATVSAIRLSENDARGFKRRHCFLRCIDHQGRERAAIDSTMLGTQLGASMLVEGGSHARLNSDRQGCWEDQLGIIAADGPLVLHSLQLIFHVLNVDVLVLGGRSHARPAQAV